MGQGGSSPRPLLLLLPLHRGVYLDGNGHPSKGAELLGPFTGDVGIQCLRLHRGMDTGGRVRVVGSWLGWWGRRCAGGGWVGLVVGGGCGIGVHDDQPTHLL